MGLKRQCFLSDTSDQGPDSLPGPFFLFCTGQKMFLSRFMFFVFVLAGTITAQEPETATEKEERLTSEFKNALKTCYREFRVAEREDTGLAIKAAKDAAIENLYQNNGEEFSFKSEVFQIGEKGYLLVSTEDFFKRFPLTKKQVKRVWLNTQLTKDEIKAIKVGSKVEVSGKLAVQLSSWNFWDKTVTKKPGESLLLSYGKTPIRGSQYTWFKFYLCELKFTIK